MTEPDPEPYPPAPPPVPPPPLAPPPVAGQPPAPPPYPTPGEYPVPPAVPSQPGGPVPAPVQSDETVWAVLAHLSFFVLSLIGPLVIMLVAGPQRPFARANGVEALNFHITLLIAGLVSVVAAVVTFGILFFLPLAVAVYGAVFAVLAAVKSGRGEGYRYPLTLRMVH